MNDINSLILELGSKYEYEREHAAFALGERGDKKAVNPLIQALQDKSMLVRKCSALSLGKLGAEIAVEALTKSLNDEHEEVRRNSAEALGQLGDKRAVEPLILCLQDKSGLIDVTAAEALGKLGDKRAVEPLILCLQDKSGLIGETAAEALGKLGDMRAVVPLIRELENEDYEIRASAAEALGKLRDKKAIEPLSQAYERELKENIEDNKYVRIHISGALYLLGEGGKVSNIITALEDSDEYLRKFAAQILGDCEIRQAIGALSKRLEIELDPEVKESISVALKKVKICSIQITFNSPDSLRVGEWGIIPVTLYNQGDIVINDICLGVRGPVEFVEITLNSIRPHETKSANISIKPKELGHVPVVFEYKYKDEDGNQKSEYVPSTLQVKNVNDSKASTNHQVIVHGNYEVVESGGIKATDSVVTAKTTIGEQDSIPFTICPYCGKELKLLKTPNFCPYCRERLVA